MARKPDGSKAWLPYAEISYEADFNPKDAQKIQEEYPLGNKIEVLVIGKATSDDPHPVVSLAAAINDPWDEEIPNWLENNVTKVMVVTDTVIPGYYRGQIQPGIEAQIEKKNLKVAFGKKGEDLFYVPRAGDRLAGMVIGADTQNRVVRLSAAKLFREFSSEDPLDDSELPLRISHKQVFEILSDTPEMQLRKLVEEKGMLIGQSANVFHVAAFNRVLILDDVPSVAGSLARNLQVKGIQVEECWRIAQARRCFGITKDPQTDQVKIDEDALNSDSEPIEAAIIDINLENNKEDGELGGIIFARELQNLYPNCKIILISGEPISDGAIEKKMKMANDLLIHDFLFKPFVEKELLESLSRAREAPARKARHFLREQLTSKQPYPSRTESDDAKIIQTAREKRDEIIKYLLTRLGEELGADSVFLFSMHPVTYETEVVGQWGNPLANWNYFRDKLRYSPVRDVCLDPRPDFKGWYDEDARNLFGKHRYLLYCYADKKNECWVCRNKYRSLPIACDLHRYRSCCAVPVSGGPGNSFAYSLFAISNCPCAFDKETVLIRMRLAAANVSAALREYHEECVEEENFPFLMSGRSACSFGHDLCNYLQHGIDIDTALQLVEKIRKSQTTPEDVKELMSILQEAKRQLNFAGGVARSFSDLSRDHDEPMRDVYLGEILEGKSGARRAAHPEITENDVTVYAPQTSESVKQQEIIHARKNAMVRVFQNLLNNSAQQIGAIGILPGAIRIDSAIKYRKDKRGDDREMLCVDVIDTGPGLHWSERERIFKPKVTTRKNGSGMGLYIVQQEVSRIGGFVGVAESILGLGTKMRLWLPLVDSVDKKSGG